MTFFHSLFVWREINKANKKKIFMVISEMWVIIDNRINMSVWVSIFSSSSKIVWAKSFSIFFDHQIAFIHELTKNMKDVILRGQDKEKTMDYNYRLEKDMKILKN